MGIAPVIVSAPSEPLFQPSLNPARSEAKTERMRTLTETQHWVLNFIYWNPGCLASEFMAEAYRLTEEEQLVAAGGLVVKGLLSYHRDIHGRFNWSPTERSEDYLDVD